MSTLSTYIDNHSKKGGRSKSTRVGSVPVAWIFYIQNYYGEEAVLASQRDNLYAPRQSNQIKSLTC